MLFLIVGVWLLAAAMVAVWLCRTWSPRRGRARTRAVLITSGTDAVVILAAVRAIAPPPPAWAWLWLVAAALVGVGLAGAVRRWPALPWREPKPGRAAGARTAAAGERTAVGGARTAVAGERTAAAGARTAAAGAIVYAAVGAGLLAVLA
jgi:hypothetical protein